MERAVNRWVQLAASGTVFLTGLIAVMAIVGLAVDNFRLRTAIREGRSGSEQPIKPGLTLPDAAFLRSDGGEFTLSGQLGHSANGGLLYFFTTTCPYCRQSLPKIGLIARTVQSRAMTFWGISLDGEMATRRYKEHEDIRWAVTTLPKDSEFRALIRRVPTVLLVNRTGEVLESWQGQVDSVTAGEIEDAVRTLSMPGRQ